MDIGASIKGVRKGLNQNQEQFAAGCGMTQTNLSSLELNKTAPGPGTLKKIADHSGVPVPMILLNSVEDSDVPEAHREKFNDLWDSVVNLAQNIFQ